MSNYLITGANSEIGRVLANHLIKHGHNLALVSRSNKDHKLLKGVPWLDGVDLTKERDLFKLQSFVREQFDTPFIFIHSVGDSGGTNLLLKHLLMKLRH